MYRKGFLVTLWCALLPTSFAALADDWPQFRGPSGDGLAAATNLPLTWSQTQNVSWKVPVPGLGRSSPIVLRDRIWLLLGGPVFASPAFVGSAIYVRTDSHLYCLSAEPARR